MTQLGRTRVDADAPTYAAARRSSSALAATGDGADVAGRSGRASPAPSWSTPPKDASARRARARGARRPHRPGDPGGPRDRPRRARRPAWWSPATPPPAAPGGDLVALRADPAAEAVGDRRRGRHGARPGDRDAGPDPVPDQSGRLLRCVGFGGSRPPHVGWSSVNNGTPTKHVFVTGGVASSLGKGLTASSLGSLLQVARSARDDAEARPLPQRRPRDDEPVPARRGVRHQRRRRDRPRHRPLRAVPRHRPRPDRERHDRAGLLERDRQGAPRRLPRRHRPGDPAHHQRDQGPRPAPWAAPTSTS